MRDLSGWKHAFGVFDAAAPGAAPENPAGRGIGVNVVGNFGSEKGVGESVRSVVRGLTAAGIPVRPIDLPDPGAVNAVPLPPPADLPPYPVTLLSINPDTIPLFARAAAGVLPRGGYVIGNWHWELPEFPAAWADRFALLDEVWVGSRFTLDAVARASPVPVVRVPPCLPDDPAAGVLTRARLGIPPEAVLFLFVYDLASTVARKNPDGVVRAFRAAFPTESDVRLVVKVSRGDRYPGKREVIEAAGGDGRVVLLDGVLPRGQVLDLIEGCDCYVSLHRAEGFGLTLAEAMARGKPVVATGYSGNTDFATPWTSYPVGYRLTRVGPAAGPYPADGVWAEPDAADAARQLRAVYADRAAAAAVGRAGREVVAAEFSPAAVGAVMARRLAAARRRVAGQL